MAVFFTMRIWGLFHPWRVDWYIFVQGLNILYRVGLFFISVWKNRSCPAKVSPGFFSPWSTQPDGHHPLFCHQTSIALCRHNKTLDGFVPRSPADKTRVEDFGPSNRSHGLNTHGIELVHGFSTVNLRWFPMPAEPLGLAPWSVRRTQDIPAGHGNTRRLTVKRWMSWLRLLLIALGIMVDFLFLFSGLKDGTIFAN